MDSTLPMSLGGGPRLPRSARLLPAARAGGLPTLGVDKHRVGFTASGSDYFRLWLSNLLLIIVTAGIYTPWARRRRIQYFFRNTLVGPDPLDFTASSRSMVTSFLLVALVYLLVNVMSSQGLNTAVSLVTFTIALAAPWLWRSALRFRLANIDWRGIPFEFQATVRETYVAAWPLLAFALATAAVMALLPVAAGALKSAGVPRAGFWLMALLFVAGGGLALIRLPYNFLNLQMTRTTFGGQMGNFKARFGDFVKVGLMCLGIGLVAYLLLGVLLASFSAGLIHLFQPGRPGGPGIGLAIVLIVLLMVAILPLLLLPASITFAVWEAMVFRTVWGHAGLGEMARSKCSLSTRAFVLLRAKNAALTVLTLGFYRPFAAVAEYRMKVESVRIYTRGDIDTLANMLGRGDVNAMGDAAADFAGLDLAV
jgi:uncharacterized membrane protein YjgN (DUF898 family)